MKKICVVTHTEASHTIDGKVGGWFNSDLTAKGIADAQALRTKIADLGFNIDGVKIYSSDLNRAKQTAACILGDQAEQLVCDNRLREMSFGKHEGMCQQEHNQIMQPVNASGNRLDHRICEGAESRRDVATRACEFVSELMNEAGDAIVVTHGFAGSFIIAAFQGIAISSMGYLDYKLKPGSVTLLEADDLFQNRSIRLLNG